jgi:hypothetical protein
VDAANRFSAILKRSPGWTVYQEPELDILGYFMEPENRSIRSLNRLSREIFDAGMKERENGFHLSLFTIPSSQFQVKVTRTIP